MVDRDAVIPPTTEDIRETDERSRYESARGQGWSVGWLASRVPAQRLGLDTGDEALGSSGCTPAIVFRTYTPRYVLFPLFYTPFDCVP